eukprot:gnl/MRDRNA2_/MRDRNA2_276192_c0_seq1.p2 gnl/MRDRNA2_/MRDRNA2_276192_c0~~gnl/MRDRNA2_/MRDRNA2_276192_c0_seq1.p2  ORF type:complete len:109 (-),score=18.15 gnl/MRDRNA2_/MRDRNA2_276192_c0_seq1:31-357(-)
MIVQNAKKKTPATASEMCNTNCLKSATKKRLAHACVGGGRFNGKDTVKMAILCAATIQNKLIRAIRRGNHSGGDPSTTSSCDAAWNPVKSPTSTALLKNCLAQSPQRC